MKLYLHIGTEKTGTSSIQETLFVNKEQLRKRGYHFVQSVGEKNNRKLPAFCMRESMDDDFFVANRITTPDQRKLFKKLVYDSLRKELSSLSKDIHTVIISSEHFHSRIKFQDEVENVRKLLSPYFSEIKIICYVREQSATLTSLYSTSIKVGSTGTLQDMLSFCKPENTYYNYYLMLSLWRKVFGPHSLIVRKFDKASFRNKDLLNDFFHILGDDLYNALFYDITTENESLNNIGQYLGLAINKAFPKDPKTGLPFPASINAINSISQSFTGEGQSLSLNEYNAIYAAFESSNIKLNEEFFGGAKGESCFERQPPAPKNNQVVLEASDIPKLAELFKAIVPSGPNLPDHYADLLRDAAVSLQHIDLTAAHMLMELAHQVRPDGPIIKKRLNQFKEKLNLKKV